MKRERIDKSIIIWNQIGIKLESNWNQFGIKLESIWNQNEIKMKSNWLHYTKTYICKQDSIQSLNNIMQNRIQYYFYYYLSF
jgi:hypothetical protein